MSKITLVLPKDDPIDLDWPVNLPLPRLGEFLTFTDPLGHEITGQITRIHWDAAKLDYYPTLQVWVEEVAHG